MLKRPFFPIAFVLLALLWFAASPGNFAEQAEPGLPQVPPKFADEGKILATYQALLAAPPWNGAPDPRRVLVAGIADLAYDRAGADTRGAPLSVYTLPDFKKRYLPGLDDLLAKAVGEDAELRLAIELVIRGVAWSFFDCKPVDKYLAVQQEIADFVRPYRLGVRKGEINSPLLRQALTTAIVGMKHDATNYDGYTVGSQGIGIFMLQELGGEPLHMKKGQTFRDYNWKFPVNPLVAAGANPEGSEISISGEYHTFVVSGGGVSSSLATEGLQPFGESSGLGGENRPFLRSYFQGPAFLQRFYGQCIFDAPSDNDEPDSLSRLCSEGAGIAAPMFVDPRAIRITQKFVFSRDVFKLIDPRSPAYSPFVHLAVQSDRLGVPLTPAYLDRMTDADRKEFARYQEYIDNSHAYLAALYPRTWEVSFHATNSWLETASSIRLPDYGTRPQFSLVFLPQEWTVVAARVGLDVALFDYNLMGIGDRRLIFGAPKPPDPD